MVKERLAKAGTVFNKDSDLPNIFEEAFINMLQMNLKYNIRR